MKKTLLFNWFKKPYFFVNSTKFHFLLSFGIGLFVFIFLYTFKPFNIIDLHNNLFLYTLGFGLVTFVVQCFFFLFFPAIFKDYFKDENWTVGRNIFFLFTLIIGIAFANWYYNSLVQDTKNNALLTLKDFFAYTFLLASIALIVFKQISEKYYTFIKKKSFKKLILSKKENIKIKKEEIIIYGDNNKEKISFNIKDLIYVSSEGNYASFYINKTNKLEELVIRNTLTNISKKFKNNNNIIRCHKSYIINTNYINSISGNARGYYLYSNNIQKAIPVSRKFKKEDLKKLIS